MEKHFAEAWSAIWPILVLLRTWLTSWLGARIEAGLGAAVILALSFWIARAQNSSLRNSYEERRFRGPVPTRIETITRQLGEIDDQRSGVAWTAARQALAVGLFGFVIPSAVIALSVLDYSWFVPNGSPLAKEIGCGGHAAAQLNFAAIALFVLSQFFMGFGQHIDEVSTRLPALSSAASLSPTNSYIVLAIIAKSLTEKELSDLRGLGFRRSAMIRWSSQWPGPRSLADNIGGKDCATQAIRRTRNGR